MNDSHIGVRYARALFKSALEQNLIDSIYTDMVLLHDICKVKDFMNMIETPTVSSDQKRNITLNLLKGKINDLTGALIKLVMENRRGIYIPAIARNYQDIYKKHKGIKTASLVTAARIDDALINNVKELVKKAFKSELELSSSVDESVLGGFILTVEDQQYDASLSSGLKKIKKQLLETSVLKN